MRERVPGPDSNCFREVRGTGGEASQLQPHAAGWIMFPHRPKIRWSPKAPYLRMGPYLKIGLWVWVWLWVWVSVQAGDRPRFWFGAQGLEDRKIWDDGEFALPERVSRVWQADVEMERYLGGRQEHMAWQNSFLMQLPVSASWALVCLVQEGSLSQQCVSFCHFL